MNKNRHRNRSNSKFVSYARQAARLLPGPFSVEIVEGDTRGVDEPHFHVSAELKISVTEPCSKIVGNLEPGEFVGQVVNVSRKKVLGLAESIGKALIQGSAGQGGES